MHRAELLIGVQCVRRRADHADVGYLESARFVTGGFLHVDDGRSDGTLIRMDGLGRRPELLDAAS